LLAANHLLLGLIGIWPRSRSLGEHLLRLPEAAARRGEIALTFDDGPDPDVTPQVLDLVDRYQAKADFLSSASKRWRTPICYATSSAAVTA
jgi:peptidoglycan-N-acetylglucosamine deacetylase